MFSTWKRAEASMRPGGEDGSQPEGSWALLQGSLYHIFILLLAEGARGVDEAPQGRERERVAQGPLLEARQRPQALLARGAGPGLLQPSGQHPRATARRIQQDVLDLTITLVCGCDRQEVLLGQLAARHPSSGQQGGHRRQPLGIQVKGKDLPLVLEKSSQVTGLIAWGSACVNDMGTRGRSQQHGWETAGLVLEDEVTSLVQWMFMQICLGWKHKQLWQQGIQKKTLPFEGPYVLEAGSLALVRETLSLEIINYILRAGLQSVHPHKSRHLGGWVRLGSHLQQVLVPAHTSTNLEPGQLSLQPCLVPVQQGLPSAPMPFKASSK